MAIAFATIDTTKLNAGIYVETVAGPKQGAFVQAKRMLIIGTATAASSGAKLAVTQVFAANDGHDNWGYGTPIGTAVEEAFATGAGEVYVLASTDASGTAATWIDTLTVGPSTAVAVAKLKIAGVEVRANVPSGSTITQAAAAVVAAVNANTKLPVSAGNVSGVITYTAKWKGADANDVVIGPLAITTTAGAAVGITVTRSAGVTGAGNPDQTAAMGVLQNTDVTFTEMTTSYTDSTSLGLIEDELARRVDPAVGRRCRLYVVKTGSQATVTTWKGSRSSPHVCAIAVGTGAALPWLIAAHVAALRSKNNNVLTDAMGTVLPNRIPAPTRAEAISTLSRETLAGLGVSSLELTESGQLRVEILRLCNGMEVNVHEILGASEYDFRGSMSETLLNRYVVSDTKEPQASNEISPKGIRSLMAARITGAQAGFFTDPKAAAASLLVERNPTNLNAIDIAFSTEIVKLIRRAHLKLVYT